MKNNSLYSKISIALAFLAVLTAVLAWAWPQFSWLDKGEDVVSQTESSMPQTYEQGRLLPERSSNAISGRASTTDLPEAEGGANPSSASVLTSSTDPVVRADVSVADAPASGSSDAPARTGMTVAEVLSVPVDLSDPKKRAELVAKVRALENAERAALHEKARRLGVPITGIGASGRPFMLRGFEGDTPVYEEPDNQNAAISTAANLVRLTAPFHADGNGLVFGLWESGGIPRLTHQEFAGKVTVRDGAVAFTDHATHVAGTLAGLGVNPSALGMAPAALIDAYDSANDVSEMLAAGAAFAGEAGKIQISNHSYGARRGWYDDGVTWLGVFSDDGNPANDVDYGFGRYDSAAVTLDGLAYNLPYYLAFFSNGNMRSRGPPAAGASWNQGFGGTVRAYDPAQHPAGNGQYKAGYDTMDGRKTAKNIMSIGAANDAVSGGARHLPSSTITSFSSSGPTDDGRIKPDVVANGASLTSAGSSSDTSYYSSSGTSMSTPNSAGSAMLLADLYQRRFPGQAMRASTLKGLIIHTADDIGIPGPDYMYGWGLMNTEAAARIIEKQAEGGSNPAMIENVLTTADPSQNHPFTWNGVDPIRVTLCWTDPPGASTTAHDLRVPSLVNDLNLSITVPGGGTHLPFVMPYVGDWSVAMLTAPASTGVNNVDNVEQVLIESPPTPGQYVVTVNHAGSLANGAQPYSLIISGGGVPDDVRVSPITGFVSSGDADGPFAPVSKEYVISNDGDAAESWSASVNRPWLSLSAASGSVPAGGEAEITVMLTTAVNSLPVGIHEGTLTITAGGVQHLRPVSLTVTGYPQIVVEQPEGSALANGAGVDFGGVLLGTRKPLRFAVRNAGNQTLNLGTVTLSGAGMADYTVGQPIPSVLPPGARAYFDVAFTPLSQGQKPVQISIPSDAPDDSPFLVQITGAGALLPGGAQLTRAINTQSGGLTPLSMLSMGGYALFSATDVPGGQELWRTDGTEAGTFMVKDIWPGRTSSVPGNLVRIGNMAYFTAAGSGIGTELWRSDGTEAGTVLVRDINPGASSPSIFGMTAVGDTLFFRATLSASGAELWKSDGTSAGTVLVRDIVAGSGHSTPANLTNVNGTLFFSASTPAEGNELWKSDGTEAGTVLVKDIFPGTSGSSPSNLANVNGVLFFTATDGTNGFELWKSDGTEAGTVMVKDIQPGSGSSSPLSLIQMDGVLYFRATTTTEGYELWRSDGSEAGTFMVKEIQPGTNGGLTTTPFVHAGKLYFSANDGALGAELWTSDGTEAGTVMLKDIYTGTNSSTPQLFTPHGGQLFFSAFTAQGRELWITDGTAAGTLQVRDIAPGSAGSTPQQLADIGSCLVFSADDGVNGREVWRSDGTEAGTWMVKDGNPNPVASTSFGTSFRDVGGTLYFGANDSVSGIELWRSDGTQAGTHMVRDILAGSSSSSPVNMTAVPGGFVFSASTSTTGSELHFSDGTAGGTQLLLDINPGTLSSSANNFLRVGDVVFFSANNGTQGGELWKTDGTVAGTVMVKDINPGTASSSPTNFSSLDGILYFSAGNGVNGTELWRSDGTAAGTQMVRDIAPGSLSSSPLNLAVVGDHVYFSATDSANGRELWRTDGTQAGTVMVADINPGSNSSSPAQITAWNDRIYFTATNGSNGIELWKSDGTPEGTVMVKDIQPGSLSSTVGGLTALPEALVFSATSSAGNFELWKSDGTEAGTVMVKDILPGGAGSSPVLLTRLGVHVYFRANDGVNGIELWRTDGTEAGTELVSDLYPGAPGSEPANLTVSGNKLFFTATHPDMGLQLFHVEGTLSPVLAVEQPAGTPRAAGESVDFGAVFPGASSQRVLTLRNNGSLPLVISSVDKSGADAGIFTLGAPGQTTLAAGESTTLTLTFAPDSTGAKSAQLQIGSNDPDHPVFALNLAGSGIGAPVLRVEQPAGAPLVNGAASVSFASATLGGTPASRSFALFNDGPGTLLEIGSITVSGSHAADFSVVRAGMSGSLPGGSGTAFSVDFAPRGTGARSAVLSIASNDPDDSPFTVTLTGTGSAAPGPGQDIITVESRPRRPGDGPFSLQAFATSGLPLGYEVLVGPATVDAAGMLTPAGASGAVTLRITQAGGGGYDAVEKIVTLVIGDWPVFTKIYSSQNGYATYAIRDDGTMWTWGYSNSTGYLGASVSIGRISPAQVGSFNDWSHLTMGNAHGLGLRSNGTLWAWGQNANGQLGDGTTTVRSSPVQVGLSKAWSDVCAGTTHTAAVATDGTLWTWGINSNGQLGLGDTTQRTSPVQVGTATHWSRVAAGSTFTMALTTTGEIWAWGSNSSGQLGIGSTSQQTAPVRVGTGTDWVAIATGNFHALALRADGTLWAWGAGTSGQLGEGLTMSRTAPVQIGTATDWQSIRAGSNVSLARKTDGSLWAWGWNSAGQIADGTLINRTTPAPYTNGTDWLDMCASSSSIAALRADGTVWVSGDMDGFTGASPRALSPAAVTSQAWQELATGGSTYLALRGDGTLWGWGYGSRGALGNGSTLNRYSLIQIGMENQWARIFVGSHNIFSNSSFAIKTNGTLWGAGYNTNYNLGDGTTSQRNSFLQIGAATDWAQVAVGQNHGIGLKTGGTLWGWGSNSSGQLGDGTTSTSTTPKQIGADTAWKQAAAGYSHTMAIKTDGSLWAWGLNSSGQLGFGDTASRTTPTRVGSDNDWTSVAAGGHTLAVKEDGSLWAWGFNSSGALGLGDTTGRTAPVRVGTENHWTRVWVTRNSSLAMSADGRLWAAGDNHSGHLGNGDTASLLTFTPVADAGFEHVALGSTSMAAISADGTFWTAGTAGSRVMGGARDHKRSLLVAPGLVPQNITPWPDGQLSGHVTASSGLPAQLRALSGPVAVNGTHIEYTGAKGGSAVVLAWQPGDETAWNAAPPVRITLELPFGAIQVFDGTTSGTELASGVGAVDFGTLTTGSNAVRTFTIANSGAGVLDLSGVQVTGDWSVDTTGMSLSLDPGQSTSFTATFAPTAAGERGGGVTILSDDPDEAAFIVAFTGQGRLPQSITFHAIPQQACGTPLALDATASSELAVSYEITQGAAFASLENGVVTFTGTGMVTVRATQAGDATYAAAAPVDRGFEVVRGVQVLAFHPDTPATASHRASVPLSAASDRGLAPVTFSVFSGPGQINDSTLSFTAPGPVIVQASQAGDECFLPATTQTAINAINTAPVAQNGGAQGDEDTPINGQLVANDIDGDTLTYAKVADPSHGAVVVNANGTFTYTPNQDYHGPDSFTFKANDGLADSNTATVSITVLPVNDAPVAQNGSAQGDEDTPINGQLVATDVDGDDLTYSKVADPSHGAVVVNADGSFTYTPSQDYNGPDSFTFKASDGELDSNTATVSITVFPVNDAPVALAQNVSTPDSVTLPILLAGTDVDGDPLTYHIVEGPQHGQLSGDAPAVSYLSGAGYAGPDSFTFKVNDGTVDSGTVTVSITVNPVAPVITVEPVGQVVNPGARVELAAQHTGSRPLTYVWRKGARSSTARSRPPWCSTPSPRMTRRFIK